MSCPFCERATSSALVDSNDSAVAFSDGFPISAGHTLVAPRRHERDVLGLTPAEQVDLWALCLAVVEFVRGTYGADGVNVGINLGPAAGQTIEHLHMHVIPRYEGDSDDPRGGVRWVLPEKAAYWQ